MTITEMTEKDQNYPQIPDGGNQVLQSDKLNMLNEDIHELKMLVMETEMEGEIVNLMTGPNHLQGKNISNEKIQFLTIIFPFTQRVNLHGLSCTMSTNETTRLTFKLHSTAKTTS